jgi:hypothetical protein
MNTKTRFFFLLAIVLGICQFVVLFFAFTWFYTTGHLASARHRGVYASPEAGMRQLIIARSYVNVQKVEIVHAGTNSFDGSNAHIAYVIAKVWAEKRADGTLIKNRWGNPEVPGSYFLHVNDGWVWVSEGSFPEFIGFGMKVYGLAGD